MDVRIKEHIDGKIVSSFNEFEPGQWYWRLEAGEDELIRIPDNLRFCVRSPVAYSDEKFRIQLYNLDGTACNSVRAGENSYARYLKAHNVTLYVT